MCEEYVRKIGTGPSTTSSIESTGEAVLTPNRGRYIGWICTILLIVGPSTNNVHCSISSLMVKTLLTVVSRVMAQLMPRPLYQVFQKGFVSLFILLLPVVLVLDVHSTTYVICARRQTIRGSFVD